MNYETYISAEVLVVGTGAAGYNAACRLRQMGKDVAMVTEGRLMGTSRNTGSDKQTYYKLSLAGDTGDSVRAMARDLFAGGSVDGDNALCEAALSARCFMNLCELGVPFPVNRYGEYVGYKTDHDPRARATSAGPLTSRFMTEALEKLARQLAIPVYDNLMAVEILKDDTGVCGLLCLDKESGDFRLFRCADLVLATGGPAGIYAHSVYPQCHTGSSSLAFLAGAEFQNMTEWQYGLASTEPRWNVSGTYMQVLPRVISVDESGVEREFLLEHFKDPYKALSALFLKGYQWPFDSGKVMGGSSVIDLLVYRQSALLGRKVYLDYRENPFGLETIAFEKLAPEALDYLKNADACFGRPIDRLLHMNTPAVDLYAGKGVDLRQEPLPIALCAQHNNGGIAVDMWWQTRVPGLFAVGECAGTHGVRRPGGSALNAGQVGSLQAARYIARRGRSLCGEAAFAAVAEPVLERHQRRCEAALTCPADVDGLLAESRLRMSRYGGAIRDPQKMEDTLGDVIRQLEAPVGVSAPAELYKLYQYRDTLVCQQVALSAMLDYSRTLGVTRGSALYYNENGEKPEGLEECFRFTGCDAAGADRIQQGCLTESGCEIRWRPVRPMPGAADVFETIWRGYRENENVY